MTSSAFEVSPELQGKIEASDATQLLLRLGEVSPHTLAHSLRLGQLAIDVGLPDYALPVLLHDNGKVDRTITHLIEGSSWLNDQQRNRVARHTTYGERNISRLDVHPSVAPELDMVRFVARHHHDSPAKLLRIQEQRPHLTPLVEATLWVRLGDIFDAGRDPNRKYKSQVSVDEATSWALAGMENAVIQGESAAQRIRSIQANHTPPVVEQPQEQSEYRQAA